MPLKNKRPTDKQRKFAKLRVEGKTLRESLEGAGYSTRGKTTTQARNAQKIESQPAVRQEIARLQERHNKRHDITVDKLLEELEEARQIAMSKLDGGSMVRATMGKAKILGLDKNILKIEAQEIGLIIERAERKVE